MYQPVPDRSCPHATLKYKLRYGYLLRSEMNYI